MQSVGSMTNGSKTVLFVLCFTLFIHTVSAQDNSPYSRFGIGDPVNNQHIVNKAMGGISAGFQNWTTANFVNPAANYLVDNSKPNATFVLFDIGSEISFKTLQSNISPNKYRSANPYFSYMHLGFPISSQKMKNKKTFLAFNLGIKPISNISYKLNTQERLPGIDSVSTYYEGSGGLNQAYIGTAFKYRNLSIGFNLGYEFGNKTISTKRGFINDTVSYVVSKNEKKTTFQGMAYTVGLQYDVPMKNGLLRLGTYGNLQHDLRAKKDEIIYTYVTDYSGQDYPVDTVAYSAGISGEIRYPLKWGVGFTYMDNNNHWLFGADFEQAVWENYSEYGTASPYGNSFKFRAGAQFYPSGNKLPKKFLQAIQYRFGFYYGEDPLLIEGEKRADYAFTAGAGLPLHSFKFKTDNSNSAMLNTSIEVGGRGNKDIGSFRESTFRFNIGVSFTGNWFKKRVYY